MKLQIPTTNIQKNSKRQGPVAIWELFVELMEVIEALMFDA
jgi:hypothetical protein